MFLYLLTTRGLSPFQKQQLFDPGLLTLSPTHLLASPCLHLEIFNCHSFFLFTLSKSFYLIILQHFLQYHITISFVLIERFPGTVADISGSKQCRQHHHLFPFLYMLFVVTSELITHVSMCLCFLNHENSKQSCRKIKMLLQLRCYISNDL